MLQLPISKCILIVPHPTLHRLVISFYFHLRPCVRACHFLIHIRNIITCVWVTAGIEFTQINKHGLSGEFLSSHNRRIGILLDQITHHFVSDWNSDPVYSILCRHNSLQRVYELKSFELRGFKSSPHPAQVCNGVLQLALQSGNFFYFDSNIKPYDSLSTDNVTQNISGVNNNHDLAVMIK